MVRKAGLGVRKIKLNLQDNEDKVFKKWRYKTGDDEENLPVGYPQLADCGGFELIVCQPNSRQIIQNAHSIKQTINGIWF